MSDGPHPQFKLQDQQVMDTADKQGLAPTENSVLSEPQYTESSDPPPYSKIEMPIYEIELKRRKRNILTPIFSYITGLASQDELDKVYSNEQQILLAENSVVDRIQAIQSQTTTIVDSIKDQNAKVAALYIDEVQVKSSI